MRQFLKKYRVLIIFIFFVLLTFLTQHFITWYADDYGYATLSYLPDFNGYMGNNPHFSDIFSFLQFHYFNWGGRVIYFFIEIIILQFKLPIYHLFQSLVLTIIFYLLYKIIIKNHDKSNYKVAIITVLSFGLIDIMTLRSGFYWASASCLYVYPLLPFFLFMYLYDENNSLIKNF